MERGGWPFIDARMEGDRGSLRGVMADRRRSLRDRRGAISGEEEGEGRVGADVGVPHVSDREGKKRKRALVCGGRWAELGCCTREKKGRLGWAGPGCSAGDFFLNKKLFPFSIQQNN